MKKTLWEKFGDFMDTGWRFLVCLLVFICGYASCWVIPIIPLNLVLVLLGSAAFFSTLSGDWPKASYVCKGSIKLPSGEDYHYTIIKMRYFQQFPILPFMTPFFFFPYKTEYYILHNTRCVSDIKENTAIETDVLDYKHLQYERIYKTEFKKITGDPQYCQEKFSNYLAKQKESFDCCVKKFEDIGYIEKICSTETSVLYKRGEDFVVFLYSGEKEKQIGLAVTDDFSSKFQNENAVISFEMLVTTNADEFNNCYIYFNDETYRQAWFEAKSDNTKNDKAAEENESRTVQYADVDEVAAVLGKDDRAELANYNLGYALRKRGKWKYMLGCILVCYFGLPIVIAGFITLTPIGIVVGIVGLILGIFLFRKLLEKYKSYPKSLPPEEFTVVKAVCTDITVNEDGEKTYIFSEGSTITEGIIKDVGKGHPCFLVFRNENNKLESVFSAITHKLADEVKFIDKMNG